jgi:hypothetical protein
MMQNFIFSNSAGGTRENSCTMRAADALERRNLLVMFAADPGSVQMADGTNLPIGTVNDEAAEGDPVAVQLLGGARTLSMVAADGIAQGNLLVCTTSGMVTTLPSDAGSYVQVGMAMGPAAADESVEVFTCFPRQITVTN